MFLFPLSVRELGIVSLHRFGHPLCGYVRYWTWFHSLVLGLGTVQPRSSRHGHFHRRHRQLDGQLYRWLGLPANSGKTSLRFSSAFRILIRRSFASTGGTGCSRTARFHYFLRFLGLLRRLHVQEGAGDKEQDYRRDQCHVPSKILPIKDAQNGTDTNTGREFFVRAGYRVTPECNIISFTKQRQLKALTQSRHWK